MLDRARGRPVKPVDADPWLTESALVRAHPSTANMPRTADAAGHEIIWPVINQGGFRCHACHGCHHSLVLPTPTNDPVRELTPKLTAACADCRWGSTRRCCASRARSGGTSATPCSALRASRRAASAPCRRRSPPSSPTTSAQASLRAAYEMGPGRKLSRIVRGNLRATRAEYAQKAVEACMSKATA